MSDRITFPIPYLALESDTDRSYKIVYKETCCIRQVLIVIMLNELRVKLYANITGSYLRCTQALILKAATLANT